MEAFENFLASWVNINFSRQILYLVFAAYDRHIGTNRSRRIHATIEELLNASFFTRSVSYQRRVCGSVYFPIVAWQRLGKHVPAAMKNCWRRRFLCGPCRIKGESVGLSVYFPIVAWQRLGKHVPAAMKNSWRRRFLCGPCRIKG
jgi:hypothetical protein